MRKSLLADYVSELRNRYAKMPSGELREIIISECVAFVDRSGHNKSVIKNLMSVDDCRFWQQMSEILIASRLSALDIDFVHPRFGPDFLVKHPNRNIHIEVIAPEPKGLPSQWINHVSDSAVDFPHEEILLRWTAAIKEKSRKLLGDKLKNKKGYLHNGMVKPEDAYVIAINGRLLRGFNGMFSDINGISQFPFAVEAVFGIGPMQVTLHRETMQIVSSDYQHRAEIKRSIGAPVPADTFFDLSFSSISAVWALDVDESILLDRTRPMILIHNPNATNPLPRNFLPAQIEYFAEQFDDMYKIMSCRGICSETSGEFQQP